MHQASPIFSNDPGGRVLFRIREILPQIAARVDEIEATSTVPHDLLDLIDRTGAFRMCLSTRFGGEQLSLRESYQVVEEVAKIDASVGWQLMVATGQQIIGARLPAETLEEYYAPGSDAWPKGAFSPKGIAIPVEGGYRLSGRWALASGAHDFNYVGLGFFIKDGEGVRMRPDGRGPDIRFCIVPRDGVEVIPTWDAVGLRGTRSDDLAAQDIFVPEAWQASFFGPSSVTAPMLGIRMPFATLPFHAAVVMGLLQGAIEDLARDSLTRKPAFNPAVLMKDDPVFRYRFGEIAIQVDAIRGLVELTLAILETCDGEGRDVTEIEGAKLGAAQAAIHHQATALMDQIMALSGSAGVYKSNAQQRRWRDLRCAAQHQAANIGQYGTYALSLIERAMARVDNVAPLTTRAEAAHVERREPIGVRH